nr:MAG TPA: hypothetical protein [Caudoviricetes sp.]
MSQFRRCCGESAAACGKSISRRTKSGMRCFSAFSGISILETVLRKPLLAALLVSRLISFTAGAYILADYWRAGSLTRI